MATHSVTVRPLASASPSDELPPLAVGFRVKCYGVSDWLKPVGRTLYSTRFTASRLHEVNVRRVMTARVV